MAAVQLTNHERRTPLQRSQLVVHPTYGLCRIAAIERAHMQDGLEDCYVFRMGTARNPIKVLMPVAQAEAAGLRRPISSQQAEEVLRVFHLPATALEPRSKEDLDEVAARLNSSDPRVVAATIRDLVAAGVKGWLGQPDGAFTNQRRSEQAMLTQALARLTEELAYVQHTSRATIEGRIRKCLGRTRRKRAPQVVQR
jgi:RNA polymerase-interacting CarD/CdnL/TRCF family regulator